MFEKLMKDFKEPFEKQGYYSVIMHILEYLEKHGGCPSVVEHKYISSDSELSKYVKPQKMRKLLSGITLKEHSENVAIEILQLLKQTTEGNAYWQVGSTLISALAHDIGKIPHLYDNEQSPYCNCDHAEISYFWLKDLFKERSEVIQEVCEAVRDHHKPLYTGTTIKAKLLKHAEARAREIEISRLCGGAIEAVDDWMDVDDLIERMGAEINIVNPQKKKPHYPWKGFTYRGLAYCKPDLLHEVMFKQAAQKGIVDYSLLNVNHKSKAQLSLVAQLREREYLQNPVKEGYVGRYYTVKFHKVKMDGDYFLLAMKAKIFRKPGQRPDLLERRKNLFLQLIRSVKPRNYSGNTIKAAIKANY